MGLTIDKITELEAGCQYHCYRCRQKIGSQTLEMKFYLYDETSDTIYFSIFLSVYNKRKHQYKNEANKIITGKNPFQTASIGLQMFKMLEARCLEDYLYEKKRGCILHMA